MAGIEIPDESLWRLEDLAREVRGAHAAGRDLAGPALALAEAVLPAEVQAEQDKA